MALAEIGAERHHDPLANRVDRRVRHLSEALPHVGVERPLWLIERRGRRVVSHGADRFLPVSGHGRQDVSDLLPCVAVKRLGARNAGRVGCADAGLAAEPRWLEVLEVALDPAAIRPAAREPALDVGVSQEVPGFRVHRDHLPRPHAPGLDDFPER